jgi:proline dehydrogenase
MPILNRLITTALPVIPKIIVAKVAKRYIAGEKITDGINLVKDLHKKNILATMDLLGEDISKSVEADAVREGIFSLLGGIKDNELSANVSIKLSQLGLKIDKELAYRNIRSIVVKAKQLKNFIRIDMEDAATITDALNIYYRLREEGYTNTGVVIQSYMKRSEADILELAKAKANIRLCKGIYNESSVIAFKKRKEIRDNFLRLLNMIMDNGLYLGIATHDEYLVNGAYTAIQKHGLKNDSYEFQMLLGVKEKLRDNIVKDGHRLRVYVPFGEQWYAYSIRRLKENPHMALYITKAIFVN